MARKAGSRCSSRKQFPAESSRVLAAVALAVFVGHLFPVFHRFQGGKGVATAAGMMLALDWRWLLEQSPCGSFSPSR